MTETQTPNPAALAGLLAGSIPGLEWSVVDDLCDCTYQRIGFWTNPYIGETLEYRFCCIWAEFAKQYPDFVKVTPAYFDINTREYIEGARDWDGEDDMPRAIWYRQLASRTGRPLADIRQEYASQEPPKGTGPRFTQAQAVALAHAAQGGTAWQS